MKKQEQIKLNEKVVAVCEDLDNILHADDCKYVFQICLVEHKLDSCSATIGEIGNYLYLRSYSTVVACIDKTTGNFYEFSPLCLRLYRDIRKTYSKIQK